VSDYEALLPREPRLPQSPNLMPSPVSDSERPALGAFSDLQTYLYMLRRHLWIIVTVASIVTTVAAFVSFKMKPVYQATTSLDIEADTPQIQSLNNLYQQLPADDSFIETQIYVIRSDDLAWRTICQLGLPDTPEFASSTRQQQGSLATAPGVSRDALLKAFKQRRSVNLERRSHVVEISFESEDPELAARVTNALANNFVEANFRQKYDATRQASGLMEQQLDELKAKVEKSQQALVDYERKNVIVNISEKQNVVEQRLADLSRDLTDAQSDRIQKESLNDLARSDESRVAFVAQNDLLQRLGEKDADLEAQYADALGRYGPNYPKVERLRSQIREIRSVIEEERRRMIAKIRNDYRAAVGREKILSAVVANQKAEVGKLNELLIQHNLLNREFETSQQLYENLLRRLKEASVTAGLRATNIHVIDRAAPPTVPVRPKKLLYVLMGAFGGVALGILLAFVLESLDSSIRSIEEAEWLVNAPVLALIPLKHAPRWSPALARSGNNGTAQVQGVGLVLSREPTSPLAESYRNLLSSVLLTSAPEPPQALLITSSQVGEGKTATVLNLASALAERGDPVLIIDADLRRPGIASSLGIAEGKKGLASLLTGTHSLEEALIRSAHVPNLWALTAGPMPENPAQLLSSTSMESLLRTLRCRFRYLVVDSPPVLPVADAPILSRLVDGVLFVLESGVTARRPVTRACRILENVGAKVLGVVLNKVDFRHDGYYAYYGYYYDGSSGKTLTAEPVGAVHSGP
jgi:succinoglycan biosynthesis transport protein ExoP